MQTIKISFEEMKKTFAAILIRYGFTSEKAEKCAAVFAESSLDGIYSHGANRFPRFIRYLQKGYVHADAEPEMVRRSAAIEQWNGRLGPGPLNAFKAADRAMELAKEYGLGLVALANTNHWMRGGTYGWYAARKGFFFLGWTNTMPNMPAWGGKDPRLGNNPFVMAVPYGESALVLDMALSQYSFGKMEEKQLSGEKLPTPGGYDRDGNLTDDPGMILGSWRSLPVGYWKGAAFSFMLDVFATLLSGGLSTAGIGKMADEIGVSQVFIAIDPLKLSSFPAMKQSIDGMVEDLKKSVPVEEGVSVRYPGERVVKTREENLRNGIPVSKAVWEEILRLEMEIK